MHFSGYSFAAPLGMKNAFHCVSGILGAPWSRCWSSLSPSDRGHCGVMAPAQGDGDR